MFFSVETLATVGYGHMHPATLYGHLVTTIEIVAGMFWTAVMTGVIFVRFSRPTASIAFSKVAVITQFDGQPTLMLRVANLRHQAMVEAEFRLMLLRNEPIKEGDYTRRFHTLRLTFDRLIMFPAALTLRHVIDVASPLHGMTVEDFERTDSRLMVSIVCVDSVIHSPVQSQHDYAWADIHFRKRFVEIYAETGDGKLTVDYGRLHEIEHDHGDAG
jgi:inward rectifier potassium channel